MGRPTGSVPGVAVQDPARSPEEAERDARRQLWEQRLARAKQMLESYMKATRYPPESRPASEHPDQMEMAEPERTRPLNKDGSDIQLRLKQDRVFVVGDEVVHFFVGCEDARRMPRPCQVVSASAHEAEHMPGAGGMPAVPLHFSDDGAAGDALSGDGTFTGRFQPSKQGFPIYSGTLRVDVQVRSGGEEGTAFFDIMYTPSPPALFTAGCGRCWSKARFSSTSGFRSRRPDGTWWRAAWMTRAACPSRTCPSTRSSSAASRR